MSFYNWIQEKLFDNYEEWHMKRLNYNRNGFNIVGIDNTLKAMHDGVFLNCVSLVRFRLGAPV